MYKFYDPAPSRQEAVSHDTRVHQRCLILSQLPPWLCSMPTPSSTLDSQKECEPPIQAYQYTQSKNLLLSLLYPSLQSLFLFTLHLPSTPSTQSKHNLQGFLGLILSVATTTNSNEKDPKIWTLKKTLYLTDPSLSNKQALVIHLWNVDVPLDTGDIILCQDFICSKSNKIDSYSPESQQPKIYFNKNQSQIHILHRLVSDAPIPQDMKCHIQDFHPFHQELLRDLILFGSQLPCIQLSRVTSLSKQRALQSGIPQTLRKTRSKRISCSILSITIAELDFVHSWRLDQYSLHSFDVQDFESNLLLISCALCKHHQLFSQASQDKCSKCHQTLSSPKLLSLAPLTFHARFAKEVQQEHLLDSCSFSEPSQSSSSIQLESLDAELYLDSLFLKDIKQWLHFESKDNLKVFQSFKGLLEKVLRNWPPLELEIIEETTLLANAEQRKTNISSRKLYLKELYS